MAAPMIGENGKGIRLASCSFHAAIRWTASSILLFHGAARSRFQLLSSGRSSNDQPEDWQRFLLTLSDLVSCTRSAKPGLDKPSAVSRAQRIMIHTLARTIGQHSINSTL